MPRSLFSNRQALDSEYAFQHELDNVSGTLNTKIDTTSGTLQVQHDTHLVSDDHLIYVPRDGSRGFTNTVSGVDPTQPYHLTTLQYLEDYVGGTISGAIPPPLLWFEGWIFDGTESSTNSTTYVQKVRLTISGAEEGYHRIGVSYFWRHSKLNTDHYARVQVDDTTTIFEYISSPYVDVNVWRPVSSFHYEYFMAGDHTIDFDFASESAGSTTYIRDVALEVWRVTEV